MIIANGFISGRRKGAAIIDPETGHPAKVSTEWLQPVPCQYIPNTTDRRGRANGERFTVATYTVLLEHPFGLDRAKLCDRCGRELGEFTVISEEWLEAVSEARLLL